MDEEYFKEHGKEHFELDCKKRIDAMSKDSEFTELSKRWAVKSQAYKYNQHFRWLGRPIIQFPQDVVAMQEIIWKVKPDVIVETGIARGGTLIFHASMLELLGNGGEAIGVDIALRKHNRDAIKKHPLAKRTRIINGSSIDPAIVAQVYEHVGDRKAIVFLDSNHSHSHVLQELTMYNKLVKKGSYLVVSDTFIEDFPSGAFPNRPWDVGNNPATAVEEFMKANRRFTNDKEVVDRLGITASRTGYLKCISNR